LILVWVFVSPSIQVICRGISKPFPFIRSLEKVIIISRYHCSNYSWPVFKWFLPLTYHHFFLYCKISIFVLPNINVHIGDFASCLLPSLDVISVTETDVVVPFAFLFFPDSDVLSTFPFMIKIFLFLSLTGYLPYLLYYPCFLCWHAMLLLSSLTREIHLFLPYIPCYPHFFCPHFLVDMQCCCFVFNWKIHLYLMYLPYYLCFLCWHIMLLLPLTGEIHLYLPYLLHFDIFQHQWIQYAMLLFSSLTKIHLYLPYHL